MRFSPQSVTAKTIEIANVSMGLNTNTNARYLWNGCIRNIFTLWTNNIMFIETEAKVDAEVRSETNSAGFSKHEQLSNVDEFD